MEIDFRDILEKVRDMRLAEFAGSLITLVAHAVLTSEASLGSPSVGTSSVEDQPNRSLVPCALNGIGSRESANSGYILMMNCAVSVRECLQIWPCKKRERGPWINIRLRLQAFQS